jgi:hypothetical protein
MPRAAATARRSPTAIAVAARALSTVIATSKLTNTALAGKVALAERPPDAESLPIANKSLSQHCAEIRWNSQHTERARVACRRSPGADAVRRRRCGVRRPAADDVALRRSNHRRCRRHDDEQLNDDATTRARDDLAAGPTPREPAAFALKCDPARSTRTSVPASCALHDARAARHPNPHDADAWMTAPTLVNPTHRRRHLSPQSRSSRSGKRPILYALRAHLII